MKLVALCLSSSMFDADFFHRLSENGPSLSAVII